MDQLKEIIDNAPQVQANLVQMNGEIGDLDEEVNEMLKTVKTKMLAYCKNQKKMSREAKTKAAKEIHAQMEELSKKSEKKTQIASEMYDFIDERIRDLDEKTHEFNNSMKKKMGDEQRKHIANMAGTSGRGDKKRKNDGKKNRMAEKAEFIPDFKPLQLESMDMQVHPCEPRYCICHQVSFGQMIGCDNPKCKYEWFHYQCIGITEAPKGEFICDYCKAAGFDPKKKK